MIDYRGRGVLVTGGTKGLGLAIALAFARRGASVAVTHYWASADLDDVRAKFAALDAPPPLILDADVSREEDTIVAMAEIKQHIGRLDVLVSNVAFAPVIDDLVDLVQRGLASAIAHSTYPTISYTRAAHTTFGAYPRYVLAMSSAGGETYHYRYDAIAAAKAALEALCRYLHQRVRDSGTRVNVLRTRFASTDAMRATLGDNFEAFAERHAPGLFLPVESVAEAAFGLCSGLMDGVGGQVVTVDNGAAIADNFSRLFDERDHLPLIGGDS